jgi:membrane-associated protease RseP (regulator of RpoE activity)
MHKVLKSGTRTRNRKRKTLLPETPATHILLFLGTIVTVTSVYLWAFSNASSFIASLGEALLFSATLLSVLLSHELGHFLAARFHKIDATLPYFIPIPFGIGTFGAFIQIKEKIKSRRELLDVGAAGPIAGFVVALALAIAGIGQSEFVSLSMGNIHLTEGFAYLVGTTDLTLGLGESLGLRSLVFLIKGPAPQGMFLALSPIAMGAWVGFFVTALNLIPASQLDGGHITYAVLGKKHRIISRAVFMILILLGAWGDAIALGIYGLPTALLLTGFAFYLIFKQQKRKLLKRLLLLMVFAHLSVLFWAQVDTGTTIWLIWGMILFWMNFDHPPLKDEGAGFSEQEPVPRLDLRRRMIGALALAIFILTFMPVPIQAVAG